MRDILISMTAREKLRRAIEQLTEREAEDALAFIADRRGPDPVVDLFESAPEDDEPSSPDEDASADEALRAHGRGDSASLEEVRRELG